MFVTRDTVFMFKQRAAGFSQRFRASRKIAYAVINVVGVFLLESSINSKSLEITL